MSFVEDAESITSKLHLRSVSMPTLLGIVLVLAILLVLVFQFLWGAFAGDATLYEGESLIAQEAEQTVSQEAGDEQQDVTAGQAEAKPAEIYVDVVGAVKQPGLVRLSEGDRVADAVEGAGGFSSDAQSQSVNLARVVQDGEQIVVLTEEEAADQPAVAQGSAGGGSASASTSSGGLVNINTATVAELTTLSGIGEVTAQKIVDDREANGPFATKGDITRVSGIGDKKYEAICDSITV